MVAIAWWLLRLLSLYPVGLGIVFCLPHLPPIIEPRGLQVAAGMVLFVMGAFVLSCPWLPRWIIRWRRGRALRRSGVHCYQCGYDLRGTIEAKRYSCPECGAPVRWWALRKAPQRL